MFSRHHAHQHQSVDSRVEPHIKGDGVYVEISMDSDHYVFHLHNAQEAIALGYRIYQQAVALADRTQHQTEKENGQVVPATAGIR